MYTVGIDLGGTNIAVGICDEELNIVIKGSVPTNAARDPEFIVKDMAALVDKLANDAGISYSEISYPHNCTSFFPLPPLPSPL